MVVLAIAICQFVLVEIFIKFFIRSSQLSNFQISYGVKPKICIWSAPIEKKVLKLHTKIAYSKAINQKYCRLKMHFLISMPDLFV